jgi:hypothetical protein
MASTNDISKIESMEEGVPFPLPEPATASRLHNDVKATFPINTASACLHPDVVESSSNVPVSTPVSTPPVSASNSGVARAVEFLEAQSDDAGIKTLTPKKNEEFIATVSAVLNSDSGSAILLGDHGIHSTKMGNADAVGRLFGKDRNMKEDGARRIFVEDPLPMTKEMPGYYSGWSKFTSKVWFTPDFAKCLQEQGVPYPKDWFIFMEKYSDGTCKFMGSTGGSVSIPANKACLKRVSI